MAITHVPSVSKYECFSEEEIQREITWKDKAGENM